MTNTSACEIQRKKDKIQKIKAMMQISEYTKCLKLKLQYYFLSSNRKVIFEKIQNVIRSSSYELVKNGTENLHDLDYDTPDKKLEAKKI
jgi:hypothetical protein